MNPCSAGFRSAGILPVILNSREDTGETPALRETVRSKVVGCSSWLVRGARVTEGDTSLVTQVVGPPAFSTKVHVPAKLNIHFFPFCWLMMAGWSMVSFFSNSLQNSFSDFFHSEPNCLSNNVSTLSMAFRQTDW